MKIEQFKIHIAREHQDTMVKKFTKRSAAPRNVDHPSESQQIIEREPEWARWYMNPPIQWVGIQSSVGSQQIHFQNLRHLDKFHYILGMFIYIIKRTFFHIFKFVRFSVKSGIVALKIGLIIFLRWLSEN